MDDQRRSLSYGPRPCDVAPPIIQWIPPLIHWDLSYLDQRAGGEVSSSPGATPSPVVAVVDTVAASNSPVSLEQPALSFCHVEAVAACPIRAWCLLSRVV